MKYERKKILLAASSLTPFLTVPSPSPPPPPPPPFSLSFLLWFTYVYVSVYAGVFWCEC